MSIYIVRHGESHANAGGDIIYDNPDIPLTEKGQQQARAVSAQLPPPSRIYASGFLRAQQTAQPFVEHWRMPLEILPALNEFHLFPFAHIRGQPRDAIRQLDQQYWARANPQESLGVDSYADFCARVKRFVALARDFPDNTVCFGHGIWLQALYWYLDGRPLDDMQAFGAWRVTQVITNTSIHRFDQALFKA